MRVVAVMLLLVSAGGAARAADREIALPAFPQPPLAGETRPQSMSSVRLLRELQRGGVRGLDRFDAMDGYYAVFRADGLAGLAGWLELACRALDFEVGEARAGHYDGSVFARLLNMATSLAALRAEVLRDERLAMPIGVLACRREEAWGVLPADGGEDAYILFATDEGLLVYDPPTRQLARLSEFPNRGAVIRVWF